MSLVLASASPRRRELLSRITTYFVVVPSDAEEAVSGSARERVLVSAQAKARAVGRTHSGIILGADTVVVLGEHVMGKPHSRDEAAFMLRKLSGRVHLVVSGLYLWNTACDIVREACVETEVRFRTISNDELERYLDTGEYSDKAGAYAIQGRAAAFVSSIHGEYTNVVGLPLCALSGLLRDVGMTL